MPKICNRAHVARVAFCGDAAGAAAQGEPPGAFAQRRPQITIYPRQRALGPNAKRYCRAWLAKEYRVERAGDRSAPALLVAIAMRFCRMTL